MTTPRVVSEAEVAAGGGWSSPDVADAAGVSYRQLDMWDRAGVLRPSISGAGGAGSRRRWSDQDVAIAVVLGRLASSKATPLWVLGAVADWLRDIGPELAARVPYAFVGTDGIVSVEPIAGGGWFVAVADQAPVEAVG